MVFLELPHILVGLQALGGESNLVKLKNFRAQKIGRARRNRNPRMLKALAKLRYFSIVNGFLQSVGFLESTRIAFIDLKGMKVFYKPRDFLNQQVNRWRLTLEATFYTAYTL
jgi:hypothetical protein